MKKNRENGLGKLVLIHNTLSSVIIGMFVGIIVSSLIQNSNGSSIPSVPFVFIFACIFLGIMIITSSKMKDNKGDNDNDILKYATINGFAGTIILFIMIKLLFKEVNTTSFIIGLLFTFAIIFSSIVCISYFMNYIITSLTEDKDFKVNKTREQGLKKVLKYSGISVLMSGCVITFFALLTALLDRTLYEFFTPQVVIMIIMILLVTFGINFMVGLLVFLETEDKPKVVRKRKTTSAKKEEPKETKTVVAKPAVKKAAPKKAATAAKKTTTKKTTTTKKSTSTAKKTTAKKTTTKKAE